VTWRELQAQVAFEALRLAREGVRAGSVVACLLPPGLEFVALFHAAMTLDAQFVPLNTRLTPGEIADQVGAVAPTVVRIAPEFAPLAAASPGVPAAGRAAGVVVFTSGTTGQPKPVLLSPGNLAASARASSAMLGLAPSDSWLACLPLFHVAGVGILVRSVLQGCSVEVHKRFDPGAVAAAVASGRITFASLVPTMLQLLLDVAPVGVLPGRVRCVMLGGGPVPPALVDRALAAGVPVAPTYGLTEAGSTVTVMPPAGVAARRDSAGRALPGTEVAVETDGPPGTIGEILVRGDTIATTTIDARPIERPGGWLRTGDLGWLDAEGYLYVADRRTDLIVTGGENVMPAEVEAALLAHPAVLEAGVYGRPDPTWGHVVSAAIVLREGAAVEPGVLDAWCRERLAGYKVPREWRFVASLPRTASGKLRRAALREG